MTKKQILHVVAFALVFCVMVVFLCDLFECENNTNYDKRFTTYREFEEDTIDAVYFGTSGVDRYWISAKAYDKYGMTVYPLTTEGMPAWLYINMIEEACTYQDPELFIFDIRPFTQTVSTVKAADIRARRILDAMPFLSLNRLKVAYKTSQVMRQIDDTKPWFDLSYGLSFIKYHSKWSEEDFTFENNLGNRPHAFGGFFLNKNISTLAKRQKVTTYDATGVGDLDPIAESALYELLDYIKEHKLKVLFVDTPQFREKRQAACVKKVYRILEENNCDYLGYYLPEQKCPENENLVNIDLNPKKHFYNEGHVNYYGAEIFTDHLMTYLDSHYDLPDRRNDQAVKAYWDGKYDTIRKWIRRREK